MSWLRPLVMSCAATVVGFAMLGSAASNAAQAAAAVSPLTPQQLDNGKLPSGVCSDAGAGPSSSGTIKLTNGTGTTGTLGQPDYLAAQIVGEPVKVNFGSGHSGVAAAFDCGDGGSAVWTPLWVFDGTKSNVHVLLGSVPLRSYDQSQSGFGSAIVGLTAMGHSLVVREQFHQPGEDCHACATGMTTTTWGWSPSNPGHLVITQPAPRRAVVVIRTAPSGWEGQTLTHNQTGPSMSAGHKVLVVCTAAPADGRHVTELNTGAWVASADLKPITLPDCDANHLDLDLVHDCCHPHDHAKLNGRRLSYRKPTLNCLQLDSGESPGHHGVLNAELLEFLGRGLRPWTGQWQRRVQHNRRPTCGKFK